MSAVTLTQHHFLSTENKCRNFIYLTKIGPDDGELISCQYLNSSNLIFILLHTKVLDAFIKHGSLAIHIAYVLETISDCIFMFGIQNFIVAPIFFIRVLLKFANIFLKDCRTKRRKIFLFCLLAKV